MRQRRVVAGVERRVQAAARAHGSPVAKQPNQTQRARGRELAPTHNVFTLALIVHHRPVGQVDVHGLRHGCVRGSTGEVACEEEEPAAQDGAGGARAEAWEAFEPFQSRHATAGFPGLAMAAGRATWQQP